MPFPGYGELLAVRLVVELGARALGAQEEAHPRRVVDAPRCWRLPRVASPSAHSGCAMLIRGAGFCRA